MTNLDLQTISYIFGFGGVIFGVFLYFTNPQEKLDKDAGILEQRVQW
jgi:multisubunit Na+/H+ antiporter MnhG subunit